MLEILQILTISGMIGATFLVYQALGPRRRTFTYTREEKAAWDAFASGRFGDWLTSCNIFASITSLATVYVFFLGNTGKFGWWILFPIVTIWFGAFVTNYFTRKLIARPRVAAKLDAGEESAGVILTLFLDGAKSGRRDRPHRDDYQYPRHPVDGVFGLCRSFVADDLVGKRFRRRDSHFPVLVRDHLFHRPVRTWRFRFR